MRDLREAQSLVSLHDEALLLRVAEYRLTDNEVSALLDLYNSDLWTPKHVTLLRDKCVETVSDADAEKCKAELGRYRCSHYCFYHGMPKPTWLRAACQLRDIISGNVLRIGNPPNVHYFRAGVMLQNPLSIALQPLVSRPKRYATLRETEEHRHWAFLVIMNTSFKCRRGICTSMSGA